MSAYIALPSFTTFTSTASYNQIPGPSRAPYAVGIVSPSSAMAAANPFLSSVTSALISSAHLNLKWIIHAECKNERTKAPPPHLMRRNEDRCTRLKSLWIHRVCPRRRPNAIHLRDKAGGAGPQVGCPPRSHAPYSGGVLLVVGCHLPARQLRPQRREQKSLYVYRASLRSEPRRVLVHLIRHRGRRASSPPPPNPPRGRDDRDGDDDSDSPFASAGLPSVSCFARSTTVGGTETAGAVSRNRHGARPIS